MSTQNFSTVATRVVDQYGLAGKLVVGAYRTGAHRVVQGASTRYTAMLNKRSLPLVNDAVKASLLNVQHQVALLVEGGITHGSQRATWAIDRLTDGATGGIRRIASAAARVESALDTQAVSTVGRLTLPAAQMSLKIANIAVAGTQRLSDRVSGKTVAADSTVKTTTRKAVGKRATERKLSAEKAVAASVAATPVARKKAVRRNANA